MNEVSADLDLGRLSPWLEANGRFGAAVRAEKFPGGQSNPTYRLLTAAGTFVLRRKPFGPLLPSAHAVEREYRLLAALHPTGFPVPKPLVLCADTSVIGSAFYVMEMVEGRSFWNGALPSIPPADRAQIYNALIDTLARLHAIDHQAAGLHDFGRVGNYFARQVQRWTTQYRAAQTDDVEAVERLIQWLPRTVPEQTRTSILHGDYRIDNLVYASDSARVAAVLDWELATIGDPLADFAYLAMNWVMPADERSGLAGIDCKAAGLPTLDDAVARYCAATHRNGLPDLHWYFAYNLFRLVGIVQGVKKRMQDGNASSSEAATIAARVTPLACAAWEQARQAGAR